MLLPSLPFHTWSQEPLRWEQMPSWDLITLNYSIRQNNLESTISFSAKQNYKHLNLFLTGMKMQNLPWIFCPENTCECSPEHPSPWEQLSSTASRTLSILGSISQPAAAGWGPGSVWGLVALGKPGMSAWCSFPCVPPHRRTPGWLFFFPTWWKVLTWFGKWGWYRRVTGFMSEAEHLQTK